MDFDLRTVVTSKFDDAEWIIHFTISEEEDLLGETKRVELFNSRLQRLEDGCATIICTKCRDLGLCIVESLVIVLETLSGSASKEGVTAAETDDFESTASG